MNLIGQPIEHKAFGSGIVTDLTDGIMTIRFQNNVKKFIYPDAFCSFLALTDSKAQGLIKKQLRERDIARKAAKEAVQKEQEQLRKQADFKIMANSHAVFHIAPQQVSQAVRTGQVSTGRYLSGYSRGMPRTADRIKPNSACLLTTCPAGKGEGERKIAGLFMVREDFFGEDMHDGIIRGHPHHRIFLPEERQIPFWNYFGANPPPRWGNAAFKYCSGDAVNTILSDMLEPLRAFGQGDAAADFYRYFCKINKLRPRVKPEGRAEEEA